MDSQAISSLTDSNLSVVRCFLTNVLRLTFVLCYPTYMQLQYSSSAIRFFAASLVAVFLVGFKIRFWFGIVHILNHWEWFRVFGVLRERFRVYLCLLDFVLIFIFILVLVLVVNSIFRPFVARAYSANKRPAPASPSATASNN